MTLRSRLALGLLAVVVVPVGLRRLADARSFQLFGRLVDRVETTEPRVALTIDDGPTGLVADSVLHVLAERRVRATFFVIGEDLARAPDVGRRLVAAGHELGNHSYTHPLMVLRSPASIRAEVERTDSVIRAAGHRGPIYFRPPDARKLVGLPWYLMRTGRTTVMWDVMPEADRAVAATPGGIVRHVLARVRPGSIILLHVWHPPWAASLAALGPLVDSLRARGYRVGPVRELLPERAVGAAAGMGAAGP